MLSCDMLLLISLGASGDATAELPEFAAMRCAMVREPEGKRNERRAFGMLFLRFN